MFLLHRAGRHCLGYTGFFLSFTYGRSTWTALEEYDALLTRYAGVILGENERANDECDAEPKDDAVILFSGQSL
jgi:hypothetical protein